MSELTSKEMNPFDADLARLEEIRRAHRSSKPNPEQLAYWHCHRDVGFTLRFIDRLWNEYSRTLEKLDQMTSLAGNVLPQLHDVVTRAAHEPCSALHDTLDDVLEALENLLVHADFKSEDEHAAFVESVQSARVIALKADEAIASRQQAGQPLRFKEWWPQFLKDHPRIDPESAYEESIALNAWAAACHLIEQRAAPPPPDDCRCDSGALQPEDSCPLHGHLGQPPPVDPIEEAARQRFYEVNSISLRDPWPLVPEHFKESFREWARATATKGGEHE